MKPAAQSEDKPSRSVVQTVRIATIDVDPRCLDLLQTGIIQLRTSSVATSPPFGDLRAILSLHYLSMMVFTDRRYDPTLLIEANFDGPAGPFWAELDAAIGPQLREILRCCKRPPDPVGAIFDRVTGPGSAMPLAPLLEAIAKPPAAWHLGNRGLSRARIESEAKVFLDARAALASPKFAEKTASEIHKALREQLPRKNPCLKVLPPLRISLFDDAGDWITAWFFGWLFILLPLELPGALLTFIIPPLLPKCVLKSLPDWIAPSAIIPSGIIFLVICAFAWILRGQWRKIKLVRRSLEPRIKQPPGPTPWTIVGLVAFQFLTSAVVLGFLCWMLRGAKPTLGWTALSTVVVGIAGGGAIVLASLAILRDIEERDAWQNAQPLPTRTEREIAALEDRSPQNHMGSLVHVKAGGLRSILIGLGLTGLGLLMRIEARARQGYLIDVRTIHFAHLTLLNNRSRLLFLANFDGSWENYLIDFIEKVQTPVTLVWNPGIGFPPTLFYVFEGVTHGRLFRTWKRGSMAPTLFWFSAYPELSVEQIWRQSRIAAGLRRPRLKEKDAQQWARDL